MRGVIAVPRDLPQVEVLASTASGLAPDPVVRAEARKIVDRARSDLAEGHQVTGVALEQRLTEAVLARAPLRRAINATGVLLHTNLGRAPLSTLDREVDGRGPSPIELDLDDGRRSHRFLGLEADICDLTGAEASLVVNNNAAALLLVLGTLAPNAEVVVSRGQLVEIGGSFRIPDIVVQSGASLVETGTTNRTHLGDFEQAITDSTRVLLEVHPSNFRQIGFTADVPTSELAALARSRGLHMVHDLGSGLVDARAPWLPDGPPRWLAGEPAARQVLDAGAHVVTFSGDKLLGGPQAGIICGERSLLDLMRQQPLTRALRYDKLRAAQLHATVRAHLDCTAHTAVPFWAMVTASPETIERRAHALADTLRADLGSESMLAGSGVEAVPVDDEIGSGSAPASAVPGWAISVRGPASAQELARRLRQADTPVVPRVHADAVVLSLRTFDPSDDRVLAQLVGRALRDTCNRP